MTLTQPRYSDGEMSGRDFVVEFLSQQISNHQLRTEMKRLTVKDKAHEQTLRELAQIAPVLLNALETHRAAISGFGIGGGADVRALKEVERAALLVRIIKEEYGNDISKG